MNHTEQPTPAGRSQRVIVTERSAVSALLRGLASRNVLVSALYSAGPEALLTCVLGVDTRSGVVFLDVNNNELRNTLLCRSDFVRFISEVDGAKLQWDAARISRGQFGRRPAFLIPLPSAIERVQRRSAFRVETPTSPPVLFHALLPSGARLVLPLVDLSVSGFGMRVAGTVAQHVQQGMTFSHCRLEHRELRLDNLTLVVQKCLDVIGPNGHPFRRVGLRLDKATHFQEDLIQRVVFRWEWMKIARDRGEPATTHAPRVRVKV